MKKIISLLLVLSFVLCFAACGGNETPDENVNNNSVVDNADDNSDENISNNEVTEEMFTLSGLDGELIKVVHPDPEIDTLVKKNIKRMYYKNENTENSNYSDEDNPRKSGYDQYSFYFKNGTALELINEYYEDRDGFVYRAFSDINGEIYYESCINYFSDENGLGFTYIVPKDVFYTLIENS